jgi:uroporphyrinogen decarboxylase
MRGQESLVRRRNFLLSTVAAPLAWGTPSLTCKERVDRALRGDAVDRPPFSLWHHFGLTTADAHAKATLAFHHEYRTDIVKVMSDFPYPKPARKWWELRPVNDPFPDQIRALQLIRDGLGGSKYFVETVFNPWNVAQKLSSKEEVLRLKSENPQKLLDALDVITQSEIAHARRALDTGASGILLSVANANAAEMTPDDYVKFSRPFDQRILQAIPGAPLNILHLHVEPAYVGLFGGFSAPIINYSLHVSHVPVADVRRRYSQVIAGGIDEVNYRKLTPEAIEAQWKAASQAAGAKFILTPGCSVPNDSTPQELSMLPKVLKA